MHSPSEILDIFLIEYYRRSRPLSLPQPFLHCILFAFTVSEAHGHTCILFCFATWLNENILPKKQIKLLYRRTPHVYLFLLGYLGGNTGAAT